MDNKKLSILSILALSICLFYAFGAYHLGKFKTADEYYWIQERVPQYWDALASQNLKKTLINDKPGISVALVSGAGLLFERDPVRYLTKVDDDLKTYETEKSERVNLAFRLPILIFNGLFLIFFFWIIRRTTENRWIALWSVISMSLSPILIGISQIINPDSLLWVFSTAAIFSYFALLKTGEKKFIFLTSLFAGLSVLSKYTADILFPFFFLFLLIFYFVEKKDSDEGKTKTFFLTQLSYFFLIVLGAIATITFFLPAIIVKPVYLYRLTLGFGPMKPISVSILVFSALIILDQLLLKKSLIFSVKKTLSRFTWLMRSVPFVLSLIFIYLIIGRNLFPHWTIFENIPFDIKKFQYLDDLGLSVNLPQKILLTLNPLVFSLPPVVLFLTIFSWLQAAFKKNTAYFFHVFSLSAFILSFYAAYIIMGIAAIVRYSILIFPLVSFLGALGLWQLSLRLKGDDWKNKLLLTFALMLASLISLLSIKPYYFNYSNALLPKSSIISDAWGYGGYQAAEFLNGLPGSENLTIWSDYYGVCEFFKGKCLTDYDLLTGKYSIDYYVLTRRGKIRYLQNPSKWMPENGVKALPYYDRTDPAWKLEIDSRPDNFIKIFKSS